jgi:hypothetical protein
MFPICLLTSKGEKTDMTEKEKHVLLFPTEFDRQFGKESTPLLPSKTEES